MKEKIYTIPVTEAFNVDCECPMCLLEKRFEEERIDYILGPSLMEPDTRIETNEEGFCRRHFEMLYNKQENRLGLGLIIDTHLMEQNSRLHKICGGIHSQQDDGSKTLMSEIKGIFSGKSGKNERTAEKVIAYLSLLEKKCCICSKLEYTMDRYVDVIMYLWSKEIDFRNLFNNKKGFCLKHFKQLLEGSEKYLGGRTQNEFVANLIKIQLENMERIQQEVNWFTKKFDYNNSDAPWGNSRDAVPRSIQKIVGYCNLK